MSPPLHKTKKFKDLQKLWYKKLKDDGFDDIEKNEYRLKLWHSVHFRDPRRSDPEVVSARHSYYRIAGQFLFDHKFDTLLEKQIWKHHSEGKSIRDIEKLLAKECTGREARGRDFIHKTLNILETAMINKVTGKK